MACPSRAAARGPNALDLPVFIVAAAVAIVMVALLIARLSSGDHPGQPGVDGSNERGADPTASPDGMRGVVDRSIGMYLLRRMFGRPTTDTEQDGSPSPAPVETEPPAPDWLPGRASIATYGAYDETTVPAAPTAAPVRSRPAKQARSNRPSRRLAAAVLAAFGVVIAFGPALVDRGGRSLHVTRANGSQVPGPTEEVAGETATPATSANADGGPVATSSPGQSSTSVPQTATPRPTKPTATPTGRPLTTATPRATGAVTPGPSSPPTPTPTAAATPQPTPPPTPEPTPAPTPEPTPAPTPEPTPSPSSASNP